MVYVYQPAGFVAAHDPGLGQEDAGAVLTKVKE